MVPILKSAINKLDLNYDLVIKLTSIVLLIKLFVSQVIYPTGPFGNAVFSILGISLVLCVFSILILTAYYLRQFPFYSSLLLLLGSALFFNLFDGSTYFVLRLLRYIFILLSVFFIYGLVIKFEKKESLKAFYTFVFISLLLFTITNLLTDIQLFYSFDNLQALILFLQEKSIILQILAALFIYIEIAIRLIKDKINKISLFFTISIFITYSFVLFYWYNQNQLTLTYRQGVLGDIPIYFYIFQLAAYFIFVLYFSNGDKYFHLILFILALLSISFKTDNVSNGFLIIILFTFIALPVLRSQDKPVF